MISTRDTGLGIPRENLPDLFERFSVGSDASASKYGGTGLGLALNLELCRLMGGDIAVESAVGEGSCFTITVPATPPVRVADTEHDEDAEAAWTDEEAGDPAEDHLVAAAA